MEEGKSAEPVHGNLRTCENSGDTGIYIFFWSGFSFFRNRKTLF